MHFAAACMRVPIDGQVRRLTRRRTRRSHLNDHGGGGGRGGGVVVLRDHGGTGRASARTSGQVKLTITAVYYKQRYVCIFQHHSTPATRENQCKLPKPRVFRDRTQPLDSLDDDELVSRYRLSRHCIVDLCDLERSTIRSNALSVSVALRYFATGSFQRVARDLHGVSQSSVSRYVTGVGKSLSCRASQYIMFPTNEASQRSVKFEFFDVAGLPNVPG